MIEELRPLKNSQFCSRSRKGIIFTTGIHRVFWGLKFEPDAKIGQKAIKLNLIPISHVIAPKAVSVLYGSMLNLI